MTKQMIVKATHIHCFDPQDPFMDELYFITGAKPAGHTSKTIRRIKKGFNEPVNIELLKTKIDENEITPVQITLWEQRALRDDSKASEMIVSIAKQAAAFAKDHLNGLAWSQVAVQISSWILENSASFFKRIFRDSPLGTAEIVVPRVGNPDERQDFPSKIDGQYEYHLTAKGKKGSYYHYVIDLSIEIE